MCTLLYFHRVFDGTPVLLLANRDESLDRASAPPALLADGGDCRPSVYGPRDLTAGGTWLGVNSAGVVVALTNHYGTLGKGGGLCSRGHVVMEALAARSARGAAETVLGLSPACKHFTILAADPREAFVVDNPGPEEATLHELKPGCHAVTNERFRKEGDEKAGRALKMMEAEAARGRPSREDAARLLGNHEAPGGWTSALCVHPDGGIRFGTVSATVTAIGPDGKVKTFLYAPGPPCVTPFKDCTPGFGKPTS